MRLASTLKAACLVLALAACSGGSASSIGSSSDPLVGSWLKTETKTEGGVEQTTRVYLLINADKTHEFVGRSEQKANNITVVSYGPCGKGTYVYNDGIVTLTTDFKTYPASTQGTLPPTVETKTASYHAEIVGDSLRLDQTVVYQRSAPPTERCP